MKDIKNKKIAVIGMGVEGISSERFLKEKGANVTTLDRKSGKDYLADLNQYDFVVRSPGVKRSIIEEALPESSYNKITSQTKLFFDLCPAKIIGVTGTKGKGTTSSLIYEMLNAQGKDAYLGGNIGKPPFEFLDKLNTHSWVVLELSSFQLQDLSKSPHIAVMLMITQEHLNAWGDQNYHESVEEYVDAKRNLVRFQSPEDFAILNRDYPASNESDIHTEAKIFWVSREREAEVGCFVREGKIVVRVPRVSQVPQVSRGENTSSSLPRGTRDTLDTRDTFDIIDVKDILLPGKHNYENVCAAVMAATLAGVSRENIAKVLKTFKGLEHRLELVREVNGVRYYDDSFSTTPETAIAAIEAFEAPEILILGGSSKNSDFTELGRHISTSPNIKAIIGIGVEWPNIKLKVQTFVPSSGRGSEKLKVIEVIEGCKSMKEVVLNAWEIAEAGDVVLLSPACASFDMFKNYKERGNQFKEEVNSL